MPDKAPSEREWLGIAHVPDGAEMRLLLEDGEFTIVLENTDLMSTRVSASEEALATLACARLAQQEAPQLLIGGYGMGFTLRAALAVLGAEATVTVAELVPEIIEWARGPMSEITAQCLDDARVVLVQNDVAMLIDAACGGYDAILLDVDNGPDGLTYRPNNWLYDLAGLRAASTALRSGGLLAVWSATHDVHFVGRLEAVDFDVEEVRVSEDRDGTGARHVIWLARKL